MTPIENLLSGIAEVVAEQFAKCGEVPPHWVGMDRDGELIEAVTPWNSSETKAIAVGAVRELFRQRNVMVYVFACEAWTVKTNSMEAAAAAAGHCDQHPDRREAIAYSAEDIRGEQAHAVQYILRPEHGPAKLSPLKFSPKGSVSGNMIGMLVR